MSTGMVPCSPEVAVNRMLGIENKGGQYILGTGHFDPNDPDNPWTYGEWHDSMGVLQRGYGSDCAGAAISFAYCLKRSRSGFNEQPKATVSGDLNVDSVLEDADPARGGRMELGELVDIPAPGVLLITPTIRLPDRKFVMMGHVRLILDATRWNLRAPKWADLVYLECHGGNGHKPGVTRNTGESVDKHDAVWPKWSHRAAMVRIRARP